MNSHTSHSWIKDHCSAVLIFRYHKVSFADVHVCVTGRKGRKWWISDRIFRVEMRRTGSCDATSSHGIVGTTWRTELDQVLVFLKKIRSLTCLKGIFLFARQAVLSALVLRSATSKNCSDLRNTEVTCSILVTKVSTFGNVVKVITMLRCAFSCLRALFQIAW